MKIKQKINEYRRKWDKLTDGWTGTVIYTIMGFLIALLVNTGLGFSLQTDTPVVAVFSESMVPTFLKGDMIIVEGVKNVKVGDIIVFDSPYFKFPIIHRVKEIENGKITTKGDNNPVQDPWQIELSNIHGKAIAKIPTLGWIKIVFSEGLGLV